MARSEEMAGKVERLQMALERAKAEFPVGHVFEKQSDMCELIGCSWPTLRDWINGNPKLERKELFTRGGNGVRWQFHVQPFLSAFLNEFRKDIADKIVAVSVKRKKFGIKAPKGMEAYSLAELRLAQSIIAQGLKDKIEQGRYYEADKKDAADAETWREFGERIMGAKTYVDPTGQLTVEQSEDLREYLLNIGGDALQHARNAAERVESHFEQERVREAD